MKKTILTLALALMTTASVWADGKAYPLPITITQSNGERITVRMHGNSYFHWYTDMQGNILERKGNDFTRLDVDPDTWVAQHAQVAETRARANEPIAKATNLFPHTGTPRALVILANYKDTTFSLKDPKASFEQYLNKTDGKPVDLGNREDLNYGSVKQYFMAMSHGDFAPQFDVYGPVTLPNGMAYYGGTSDNGGDERAVELVRDACVAAGNTIDWSSYDQDNDGNIDLVYVIYAGYGQNMGAPANTLWPKRLSGFGYADKFGGKGINQCGVSNELNGNAEFGKRMNGIGLFCHEFSHCLGLPDFYSTSRSNPLHIDNQCMEYWDLMDAGEYTNNGYTPTPYTAWEREAMGWDSIEPISTEGQYKLTPDRGKRAVKVVSPSDNNDYYVLEYFEGKGWGMGISMGARKLTSGMMIYHVNYDKTAFSLSSNNVNNVKGKPRMTLIPADGVLRYSDNDDGRTSLYGDLFREELGATYATFSQDGGLPNAAWWTTATPTPIYNINYAGGAVYFDFLKKVATTAIEGVEASDTPADGRIYRLDGRYMGTDATTLPHGIYIRGGKKFVK